jgi:hypothetical protein
MGTQTAVIFRCGNCRERYPARPALALGRVERGPDGIWRPYRLKRVGQRLRSYTVGVSPLGDARWAIPGPHGRPVGRTARIYEPYSPTLTLPCRDCRRTPPAEVPWKEYAILAFVQGLTEVDV